MIQPSSITTAQLNEQILKYLKPEVTHAPQIPPLIYSGETISLQTRAEGKYLTYQWHKNGLPIAGAIQEAFVIEDINKTLHDGNYSVAVSNDFGTVTTTHVTIDVNSTPATVIVDLNDSVSMEMIWCSAGTFTMGASGEQPVVTLSNGFYLSKYEVTQAQYKAIVGSNPSAFGSVGNENRPVEQVNYHSAVAFCNALTTQERNAALIPLDWEYLLPTEAQWEYACRAGTTTVYSWGDSISSTNANYSSSGIGQTREVGQYGANPWGFFDMHGNVWEWTADWVGVLQNEPVMNPTGPATGTYRSVRGGGWNMSAGNQTSAKRHSREPWTTHSWIGFRVSLQRF
jgi:formylglycine-generating enzyme required for sulfatase activity